ncbi:MAG: FCSD flavin-binding domain-containing protein [Gammaproteobacteria bacterium]|nr:FCSD flavin-binding domain-containing protein [Gammaproteobacteria bacterium]
MSKYTRRDFVKAAGVATASAIGILGWPIGVQAKTGNRSKVVVIGGGYGGATCAKYIRKLAPGVDVTLVEQNKEFITCPFSNTVIGGIKRIEEITHKYDKLKQRHGVDVIHDLATEIDATKKTVKLKSGKTLGYDKLIVSPGIEFVWNKIAAYDEKASEIFPHAWKAGPQTLLLRRQLEGMKDGGTVIITAPADPYRCPPGPYERACLIANYFKQHKPKSKIIILDAKDKFSKQPLFINGWETLYPKMIDWVSKSAGGTVVRVDTKAKLVENDTGFTYEADVINVIPPHQAGAIAQKAGLADKSGWCPVNQRTFESTLHKDVHVIGDSALAGEMPKSAYAAGSQGKVCAAAVVAELGGLNMPEPSYVNTCYSFVGPEYGISVAAVYRITDKGIAAVKDAGGGSPKDVDDTFRNMEAVYAQGWYDSTVADMFE